MHRVRRRAAFYSAIDRTSRQIGNLCEPLEQRTLLTTTTDPVIVLTEELSLTTWTEPGPYQVIKATVEPWLWTSDSETPWDLDLGDYDPENDFDGNGYNGDAYGWNFLNDSPNFIRNGAGGAHCASIVSNLLPILNDTGLPVDRVRIMFVVSNTGSDVVDYVVARKNAGVNIVAVDGPNLSNYTRADAAALKAEDILLFGPVSAYNVSADSNPGYPAASAFYHATPRRGTGLEPIDTVIPVTTDPAAGLTEYGINSYYFAVQGADAPSWANPIAATYAAIATQAYIDEPAHSGAVPSALQIKRAMLSGVNYSYSSTQSLDRRTITHDYVSGARAGMGILDVEEIIDSINQATTGITGVRLINPSPANELETSIDFDLTSSVQPTNWTISWGDNSFSDGSGVEVLPGASLNASHPFPFANTVHTYYPTIYAMLGTGNG